MWPGYFENGKQVGVWAAYDARGKVVKSTKMKAQAIWLGVAPKQGRRRKSPPTSGIDNLRCIFHRGGVRWGCPEFRCGWRWILTTSMPKLSTLGLPKSGCR